METVSMEQYKDTFKKLLARIRSLEDRVEALELENNEQEEPTQASLSSLKFKFDKDSN